MLRTLLVVGVACLALGTGVALAESPSPHDPAAEAAGIAGVVPTIGDAASYAANALGGGNLTYHGGKVLLTNRTFRVYWIPAGYTMASGYATTINRYFADVAVAKNVTTNVYAVETQYTNGAGSHIQNSSTDGGSFTDTHAYPASGCSDTVSQTTNCISDTQLRAELQRLYTAGSLGAANANTTYFVFTAKGVGSCYSAGSCAFSSYCAYHSNVKFGTTTVQYANQPYTDTVPSACDSGKYPNGSANQADPTINVASHEHRESINDPLGNAWYDSQGYEGSDKCAWNFGTLTGSNYNQTINGHHYILQQEWSNSGSTCKLHFP